MLLDRHCSITDRTRQAAERAGQINDRRENGNCLPLAEQRLILPAQLGCSTANASSPRPASTAGWCRRRRWRSTCASAWPTASACSGCRCRARSASPSRSPARPTCGSVDALFTTTCDWQISELGWMYTLFFVFLGSSAAHLGRLARARRPAQGRRGRRAVLVRRPADLGASASTCTSSG